MVTDSVPLHWSAEMPVWPDTEAKHCPQRHINLINGCYDSLWYKLNTVIMAFAEKEEQSNKSAVLIPIPDFLIQF